MNDKVAPPSWTEWTRNPNERSPQRKVFDDILGELRKEGLIEVRGSLFVHLARYSYLHVKNATFPVKSFVQSVPESIFGSTPPAYRQTEVETVLKILQSAGLVSFVDGTASSPVTVLLTERQAPGEVARGQVIHSVTTHLRGFLGHLDPVGVVVKPSSFPTPESVAAETGVDKMLLVPGENCLPVQDRPDSNETNPHPFLQETIEAGTAPLLLLQFWPLPDPKADSSPGTDPEFSLLFPGEVSLDLLVKKYCLPLLEEFFRSPGNQDAAAGIQAKYASYMHKYREKFTANGGLPASDRIDKVLSSSDIDGEGFANAVYVVVQVLRKGANPIVAQAARIAWARSMALRVHKRKAEKDAASRTQDGTLLVGRLRESARPLSLEDLKRTPDGSKKKEIGSKYQTITDLLPLNPAKEGLRPLVFEIVGNFVHRENLVRAFLDLRERESFAQQERLARLWAREGIPAPESVFLADKDASPAFVRAWELLLQERLLSPTLADFVKDYLPSDIDNTDLIRWIWPEGRKGIPGATELVNRGLDVVLYEDRDRLRRRALAAVLGLPKAYPVIVKAAWNLVLLEDGLFRFVLRKILALFGSKPKPKPEAKEAAKKGSTTAAPDPKSQKKAELKKLKELAPLAADPATLSVEREKAAGQWCFKLDGDAARRTRETVDAEIGRYAQKIVLEQLTEENSAKVAIFLIEKSPTLASVTSSRAFHRYLYLTALRLRIEALQR